MILIKFCQNNDSKRQNKTHLYDISKIREISIKKVNHRHRVNDEISLNRRRYWNQIVENPEISDSFTCCFVNCHVF